MCQGICVWQPGLGWEQGSSPALSLKITLSALHMPAWRLSSCKRRRENCLEKTESSKPGSYRAQVGRAASTLPQLSSLGPRADTAPRVLVGTCQEHSAAFPNIALHIEVEAAARGVGMAKLPDFRLESSSGTQSVVRIKHSADVAGSYSGDVSISKMPYVLDEGEITKCPPANEYVRRGHSFVSSVQPHCSTGRAGTFPAICELGIFYLVWK